MQYTLTLHSAFSLPYSSRAPSADDERARKGWGRVKRIKTKVRWVRRQKAKVRWTLAAANAQARVGLGRCPSAAGKRSAEARSRRPQVAPVRPPATAPGPRCPTSATAPAFALAPASLQLSCVHAVVHSRHRCPSVHGTRGSVSLGALIRAVRGATPCGSRVRSNFAPGECFVAERQI